MDLKEKILEKDGCPLHYWVSENISDVWLIFLHGTGVDHNMFNDQLPAIRDNYNVILLDIRGHGLSRPIGKEFSIKQVISDISAVMEVENCAKATFIGMSLGGNICQELVMACPEKVESLVLIDCTCNTMKLSPIEKFSIKLALPIFRLYPWKTLIRQSAKVSSLDKDVRNYITEQFSRLDKEDFINFFIEGFKCLHYEADYKFKQKVLLICGDRDGTGNIRKVAPLWAKRDENIEFHMIENAGHCSNQDKPEIFNGLLTAFLKKVYGIPKKNAI